MSALFWNWTPGASSCHHKEQVFVVDGRTSCPSYPPWLATVSKEKASGAARQRQLSDPVQATLRSKLPQAARKCKTLFVRQKF